MPISTASRLPPTASFVHHRTAPATRGGKAITSVDQTEWNELLAKLARIEALADRAGTLAEAEAAAAALSRLLLRHNLSLAEVGERRERAPGNGVTAQEHRLANGAAWRHYLLHALAQTHLCRAIRHAGDRATIIGHPHNLAVVKDLYRWLSAAIERLARRAWEERIERRAAELLLAAPPDAQPRFADAMTAARETPGKRAWLAAFRTGAVDGLWRRLLDERRALEAETAPDRWALVPLLEREVEVFVGERFAGLGSYAVRAGDAGGYAAGHAAGYAIDIGARQIGDGSRGAA